MTGRYQVRAQTRIAAGYAGLVTVTVRSSHQRSVRLSPDRQLPMSYRTGVVTALLLSTIYVTNIRAAESARFVWL